MGESGWLINLWGRGGAGCQGCWHCGGLGRRQRRHQDAKVKRVMSLEARRVC